MSDINVYKIDINTKEIADLSLDLEKPSLQELYQLISSQLVIHGVVEEEQMKSEFEVVYKKEVDKINSNDENSPNYIYATLTLESIFKFIEHLIQKYIIYLNKNDQSNSKIISKVSELVFTNAYKLVRIIYELFPKIENELKKQSVIVNNISNGENNTREFKNMVTEKSNNIFINSSYNNMTNFNNNNINSNFINNNVSNNNNTSNINNVNSNNVKEFNSNITNNNNSNNYNHNSNNFNSNNLNYNSNNNNNNNSNNSQNLIINNTSSQKPNEINEQRYTQKELDERIQKEKEDLNKKYQDEISLYQSKIEQLKEENDFLTQKILKNAKTIISQGLNNNSQSVSRRNFVAGSTSSLSSTTFKNLRGGNKNRNNNENGESLSQYSIIGNRIFTLKMMKDVIHEIYNSKKDFNQKCDDNQLPRETLEQHMYTFLNHKYGLKNIILEWATIIIKGIKSFSSEDAEVYLFGKIFRNEIEEDATLFLPMLKSNITNKLLDIIKKQNPYKSMKEIINLRNQKMNSSLLYNECIEIINEFYDTEDSEFLQKKVQDLMKKKKSEYLQRENEKSQEKKKKMTREELALLELQKEEDVQFLSFKDFFNLLFKCQIKAREKYLKNFLISFKKVDTDNDGIINEEEFIQLIYDLNLEVDNVEEFINRLLSVVDPYNNKLITFSECVGLLSSETIDSDEGKIVILDKVYKKNNPNKE